MKMEKPCDRSTCPFQSFFCLELYLECMKYQIKYAEFPFIDVRS